MNAANSMRFCASYLLLFILGYYSAWAQVQPPLCGTSDSLSTVALQTYASKNDLSRARTADQTFLEYRLALDINYQTYLLYGGDTTRIKLVAYEFIEKASQIFQRDVRIKLTVSSILIWKQPEPYALSSDMDYYSNILTYWNLNRREPRDAVVSLSVRSGWFYGGLRMCTSNLPGPGSPDLAVDILAHELGHTLGSPHTHSCSWPGGPIDYCELVEGGDSNCQSNFKEYTNGTLMSYCRSLMRFHPLCQNIMRAQAEGKVRSDFELKPLSYAAQPQALSMIPKVPLGSNLPIFYWPATKGAQHFKIQIARNATFSDLMADTLVGQPMYQSIGLGYGSYWIRYCIKNGSNLSSWSSTLAFSVQPFSQGTEAPLLTNLYLNNKGQVSGVFNLYEEADDYQLMITNQNNPKQYFIHDYKRSSSKKQSFSIPLNMPLYGWYAIQLRVGKGGEWTPWSTVIALSNPWNGSFWEGNMLTGNTSTPLIATNLFQPALKGGLQQSIEIATDRNFEKLVYSDSAAINKMNEWYTNKIIFKPDLAEHTTYYARTRMLITESSYTEWDSTSFVTGWKDQRFRFLGTVTPNPLSTGSFGTDFIPCNFYHTAGKLYIYSNNTGYYSTADLVNWKPVTVRSTKGKSPDYLRKFAASDMGEFTIDQNYVLTQKKEEDFHSFSIPGVSSNRLSTMAILEGQGLFFQSINKGVVHFQEGRWAFYGKQILGSDYALIVASSGNSIWAIMEEGRVWEYAQGQWLQRPTLSQWRGLKGLTFDITGKAYAYGEWGVSVLSSGQSAWEEISSLSQFPIQKLIFDTKGNIWMASYRYASSKVENYALVKMALDGVTAYRDGLAFFREPFDLTYFQDKLLILTSGGEIHQFDEDLIQRYSPPASYCGGEEISISLTSNSTLPSNANLHLELTADAGNGPTSYEVPQTGPIILLPTRSRAGELTFSLPSDVAKGSYRIRTVLDHPGIKSPPSMPFKISRADIPVLNVGEQTPFSTQLTTSPMVENSYQWIWNGQEMSGETGTQLSAFRDGIYILRSTNADGCSSLSQAMLVEMEQPAETTLLQNFPNPVGHMAKIIFYSPVSQTLELDLLDTKGAKIKSLKSAVFEQGWHSAQLDAAHLPSGIYLYRLSARNFSKTLKLIKE